MMTNPPDPGRTGPDPEEPDRNQGQPAPGEPIDQADEPRPGASGDPYGQLDNPAEMPPPSGQTGSTAFPPPPVERGESQRRVGPGGSPLVDWPKRAQSALVDWFGPGIVAGILAQGTDVGVDLILQTLALAWALYNAWLAGTTGQSYGRRWAGTRLVRASDGQLVGGGLAILRHILHLLDSLLCFVGFLWPLWDPKRQTFADKIVSSVVVRA